MKFQVNVGDFNKQLKPILGNSNSSKEILQVTADEDGLKFKIEQGDLTIWLNINSRTHNDIQYVCQERGFGAVNVKYFAWSLKSFLHDETVSVEFSDHMCITDIPDCNRQVELPIANFNKSDELVSFGEPDEMFTFAKKPFINALKAVSFAMGNEQSKPYYHGIFVEVSNDKIRCYAGTGALYAVKHIQGKCLNFKKNIPLFLPSSSVDRIIASLNSMSSNNVNIKVFCKERTCVLTSDYLELRIENIPDSQAKEIDALLNYNFPHKLCIKICDLKYPVASITGAVKNDKGVFPKPVDINIDSVSGKLFFRYGDSASQSMAPLTINSVIPAATSGTLKLRCGWNYLAELYNCWSRQNAIAIHCEINATKACLAMPKYQETIHSNEPDAILFATLPLPEDSATDEVKTENIGHAKAMEDCIQKEEMKDGQINR